MRDGRNAKLVFRASLRLNAIAAGIYSRPEQRLRSLRRPPVGGELSRKEDRSV